MIEIGIASEMDIEGIAALEADVFPDAWSGRSIEETIAQKHVTVIAAREAGQVVGYIICYQILNEGEIARVAVDRNRRRASIATRMMDYLLRAGTERGLTEYSLEVRESNEPAIAFYRSFAFAEEGRRKEFYRNPTEDGLIMWRRRG